MTPRDLVIARSDGCCERCGRNLQGSSFGYSVHHRLPRGMGGTKTPDTPERMVVLCGSGTTGCHGWVESNRSAAVGHGWLVRRGITNPADVPVYRFGQWWNVTADALVPVDLSPPF